jgi:hypothetical protein
MLRRVSLAVLISVVVALPAATAAAADAPPTTSATYAGATIDLGDGSWDGASACAVVGDTTACFDTEAAMNAWIASAAASVPAAASPAPAGTSRFAGRGTLATQALTCASSLRLYEHGNFGGRILYLSTRGRWSNLGSYGFDNITSSFRVGACTSYLAEYTNGGGAWYPGGSAYSSVGVMPGSWNDRLSSAYLV